MPTCSGRTCWPSLIGLILSSAFSAIVVFAQELVPGRVGLIAGIFFGFAFGIGGIGAAVLGVVADHRASTTSSGSARSCRCSACSTIFLPNMNKPQAGLTIGRSSRRRTWHARCLALASRPVDRYAAIGEQRGAGGEARCVGSQIERRAARSPPARRCASSACRPSTKARSSGVLKVAAGVSVPPGSSALTRTPFGAVLGGKHLRQPDQPGLACGIGWSCRACRRCGRRRSR